MNERALTIAILTLNRSKQLEEAILSCFNSRLPYNVEIIVLDNASTDNTKNVINCLNTSSNFEITYYYSEINLGVGGGRSFLFSKAKGKYVYFLDDDAVIAEESRDSFFIKPLEYMESHPEVASLSTNIYDEIFGYKRTDDMKKRAYGNLEEVFLYLGGSHFLRKSSFDEPLYYNIRYGAEECAPSIITANRGYVHVYDKSLRIIHKPKQNKWSGKNNNLLSEIMAPAVAVPYATKQCLYPRIFSPILFFAYRRRIKNHLRGEEKSKKEANRIVTEIIKDNTYKKIKTVTVLRLLRKFGVTVL